MKTSFLLLLVSSIVFSSCTKKTAEEDATAAKASSPKKLFLDVHDVGTIAFKDVEEAHQKDLAVQKKYDVNFIKYWVDEERGKVYCLAEASDRANISKTHEEAHGLVPDKIFTVSDGPEVSLTGKKLFFDIHRLGAGKVTAKDVAGAHDKDLAVQDKYGVNFINYWVDEQEGIVMCLSEAPDSSAVISTHKEAHGLIPDEIGNVMQGK